MRGIRSEADVDYLLRGAKWLFAFEGVGVVGGVGRVVVV